MLKTVEELIRFTEEAYQKAELKKSNLNPEIMSVPGMSGHKTRHFLNNIVQAVGNRYLEVGVWAGSTFCSALNNTQTNNYCVAIDNWSEFGGPKQSFLQNVTKYIDLNNIKVQFLEKDCFTVTAEDLLISKYGKFQTYLYDGPHKKHEHYDALIKYIDFVESDFVYLCDDWNWTGDVEAGTRDAFKDLKLTIHKEWVMKTPNNIDNDQSGWWNGYYAAVISK